MPTGTGEIRDFYLSILKHQQGLQLAFSLKNDKLVLPGLI